jgi:hypothetical protein
VFSLCRFVFLHSWCSLTGCIDAYKPLLAEVEKILAEAGLNEEEMRMSAQGGGAQAGGGISRNRR